MLDPPGSLRKNSFRAGLDQSGDSRSFAESLEVVPRRAGQERQRQRQGKPAVSEQSASNRRPKAPAGVSRDDLEGRRLAAGGRLHDVRLRRKPVFENRGQDPGVRVETQHQERPPPDRLGQVHPLGQSHLRQPAEQVPVRRAANLGMDPRIGGKTGEIPPVESADERESLPPGGPGMSRESKPHRVVLARGAVAQEPLQSLGRQVASPEELEVVTFGAHGARRESVREPGLLPENGGRGDRAGRIGG